MDGWLRVAASGLPAMSKGLVGAAWALLSAALSFSFCYPAYAAEPQQVGVVRISKAGHKRFLDEQGLYLVQVRCAKPRPVPTAESLAQNPLLSFLSDAFTNPTVSAAGMLTLSTLPISTGNQPPVGSVLAAIPFEARSRSATSVTAFENQACNTNFTINGHNQLFLTAVYSLSVAEAPSKFLALVAGLAGITDPLLNVIPGGASAKPAVEAIVGLGSPYSSILLAFNEAHADTAHQPLGAGNYTVTTRTQSIRVSVLKIDSVISVRNTYKDLNPPLEALINKYETDLQMHADHCTSIGRSLELDENFAHADAVYILSRALLVAIPSISKTRSCVQGEYIDVLNDPFWKSRNSRADNYGMNAAYQPYDRSRMDGLLYLLANNGKDGTVTLNEFFYPNIRTMDYTKSILQDEGSDLAPQELVSKMKSAGYTVFGCPDSPDPYNDGQGNPSSAEFLALKAVNGAGKYDPAKALVLRLWWQGPEGVPKVSEISINNSQDVISKVISDNKSACSPDVQFPKADPAQSAGH